MVTDFKLAPIVFQVHESVMIQNLLERTMDEAQKDLDAPGGIEQARMMSQRRFDTAQSAHRKLELAGQAAGKRLDASRIEEQLLAGWLSENEPA